MAGWRDAASQAAQDDLDGLLDAALDLAQPQVARNGGFHPFAVTVSVDGEQGIAMIGETDPSGDGAAEERSLIESVAGGSSGLRAVVVVTDVRLSQTGSDAIRMAVEHREGISMVAILPYRRSRLRRKAEYGRLEASASEPAIFVR